MIMEAKEIGMVVMARVTAVEKPFFGLKLLQKAV